MTHITKLTYFSLAITSLLSFSLSAQQAPAANVNVAIAQIKLLSPVAWVSGTVVSRNNSELAAEISGRLVYISELGTKIKKGDMIAKIDDRKIKIQQQEDTANVQVEKTQLAFLSAEVTRKQSLVDKNLLPKNELDEALSKRDVAKGNLTIAQSQLAQTQQNLTYTQLKAPFDGLVTQRLHNLGEYINNGTAIIRFVETANVEASLFVPLTAYQFLADAKNLIIESPLGTGKVPIKSIIPVADSRSHLMEVRLDMRSLQWPIGLNIKAAIANGESKEALSIPRDALVLRRNGMSVFKVNAENKAQQINVSVGMGVGELVEIISESEQKIQQGDQIVIRGAERLREGQLVNIKSNNLTLISGNKESH